MNQNFMRYKDDQMSFKKKLRKIILFYLFKNIYKRIHIRKTGKLN